MSSTVKNPIKLPPLRVLRVRNPTQKEVNPCLTVMQSVLACWASAGYTAAGCLALEQQLRDCADGPQQTVKKANTINHHLSRMQQKMGGRKKK
ncbi:37S ribosomal protein Mrp10 [Magnaporthiopsis poae ATCC 64411]|uniref:Small ribosomal subunit protein mS37 n=1 Tax=Magnaporthiopsis poae (strain ATCC 64411 / 73-15) TaxID=644358 RepID=A0A0C4E0M7_MAGP6|nr:37S ribosomal protein Mrp10 [Magnaporthiopsis poae ATCC 64411]